jgi:hypothetical protein
MRHDDGNCTACGTVSHGTMRAEDLIPTFLDELETRDAAAHATILAEYPGDIDYESEDAEYMLEALFDALNACAPNGHYFGAHVGDGSDYGFWACEEEAA